MSIVKIRDALELALDGMVGLIPDIAITSSTAASPAVIKTAVPHGLLSGIQISITGSTASALNGTFICVVIDATHLSLTHWVTKTPIASTASGTGGVIKAQLTAWEGVTFLPVYGVPFQKVNLLRAAPETPAYGGNFSREVGFMQVSLFYPKGIGTSLIDTRAELLQSTFKRGLSFTKDSIVVHIHKKPEVQHSLIIDQAITLSVRIPYYADIFE
jgi:hypothetical protein